jgi:hypothetical protein
MSGKGSTAICLGEILYRLVPVTGMNRDSVRLTRWRTVGVRERQFYKTLTDVFSG